MAGPPRILIPIPTSVDLEYNRQCWPQYAAAVRDAGGIPVEAEVDLSEKNLRALVRTCDGVVLPGSPADVSPERYGGQREEACGPSDGLREQCDWVLLEHAFASGMPLLGICYGMQSLNVFCGGTLLQDIDAVTVRHTAGANVGVAHMAVIAGESLLAGLVDGTEAAKSALDRLRLPVNSSHHQAVAIAGEGLGVVARSPEDGVIEAVELVANRAQFLLGVQWHPERTVALSPTSRAIFRGLIERAAVGPSALLSGRLHR